MSLIYFVNEEGKGGYLIPSPIEEDLEKTLNEMGYTRQNPIGTIHPPLTLLNNIARIRRERKKEDG